MKKISILTILLVFIAFQMNAQIGVGEWRDHLSFNYAIAVTESSSKVYVASENGVFSYNKNSYNIEKMTKVNILSDVGISSISYSDQNDVLLVGYSNGNVDLIFDNEMFNLPDIKREMISGSKSINHILFIDEFAYLSCGFGIVVINLSKREIKDTYYIGDLGTLVHVNQLVYDNDYLYAATNQGVYVADYTNQNLIDYSNWQKITDIPNYTSAFSSIYVNNETMLVNQSNELTNDVLYSFENNSWNIFNNEYSTIKRIKYNSSSIQVVTNRNILLYTPELTFQDSVTITEAPVYNPYDVVLDDRNIYWIASRGHGLIKVQNNNAEIGIFPNAPYTANSFNIDIDNDRVLVTAGGYNDLGNNLFLNGGVYSFQNEKWQSYANYDVPDYTVVKIDPRNINHFFIGCWGKGVIEYLNDEIINTFNDTSSSLQSEITGNDYCRIAGLAFDQENNLWVTNSKVTAPISVKKADGGWVSYDFNEQVSDKPVGEIIVTQNNHKWVILPDGNGLFVFDNNQTLDNKNDDLYKKLSVVDENGKIITNRIYSIVEDLNGDIWLGTNQGVLVYNNPQNVFEDANFHARRITVTIDDFTQYLLNTELITSIAVDGANQKWIGTKSSGVYHVSKDGTEEMNHFTEENSPLLSNDIRDIGINHESGEVFFATDKGLISYRGSATMGSDEFRDVYVYPNPVREDYHGEITVRGLVSDVNVKITDISGNIVYETTAEGGQATWDGKNFSGRRVSTGVYLIFCTNDDGSKTHITKLLFIK